MTLLRPQDGWTCNDTALSAYLEWRRLVDCMSEVATRLAFSGHERQAQWIEQHVTEFVQHASRHLDGIILNGHTKLMSELHPAPTNGTVLAAGAGRANGESTPATRSLDCHPSVQAAGREPALTLATEIEELMHKAQKIADAQTREVASKFLCAARAFLVAGKHEHASSRVVAARGVMSGGGHE